MTALTVQISPTGKFDKSKPIPAAGSFVSVENENVVICAFKMPEEYYTADMVIIRMRELDGEKTRCVLNLPLPCTSLWYSDHLERPSHRIEGESGAVVHAMVEPYEIVTLVAYL